MDAIDALMTTRAMRRFTHAPVTDDEVLTCLRAAQQAPSGGNVQPWQYLVVTDPHVRANIGAIYRRSFDRYEKSLEGTVPRFRTPADEESWKRTRDASRYLADHLGEAPVMVAFLLAVIPWSPADEQGALDIGPLYASVYPAVQNFMVAARALGIGTALTTVIRVEHDEARASLGVTDAWEIAALVPMGRPAGRFGVARRKPVEAVTSWDRFGERRGKST